MRRTGKDFDSPTTGREAWCGAGITKAVAFMKGLGGGYKGDREPYYAVVLTEASSAGQQKVGRVPRNKQPNSVLRRPAGFRSSPNKPAWGLSPRRAAAGGKTRRSDRRGAATRRAGRARRSRRLPP